MNQIKHFVSSFLAAILCIAITVTPVAAYAVQADDPSPADETESYQLFLADSTHGSVQDLNETKEINTNQTVTFSEEDFTGSTAYHEAGEVLSLSVIPEDGYELTSAAAYQENGEQISLTIEEDTISFTMPAAPVYLFSEFSLKKAEETETEKQQSDDIKTEGQQSDDSAGNGSQPKDTPALSLAASLQLAPLAESDLLLPTSGEGGQPYGVRYGSQYYPEAMGTTSAKVLNELKSHEHDNYYLGTPYIGTTQNIIPNGDPNLTILNSVSPVSISSTYSGTPGMQCTGFVYYVLVKSGSIPSRTPHMGTSTSALPFRSKGWVDAIFSMDLVRYRFDTKADMLASGVLEKGDIIWSYQESTGGIGSVNADHHIGFFWGNTSGEDKYWHSGPTVDGNKSTEMNCISTINRKAAAECDWWVIKIGPTNGYLNLSKKAANTVVTSGHSEYSLTGAQYTVYKDADCTKSTGKILTTAPGGKTNTVELAAGTYYVKETKAAPGFRLSSSVTKAVVTSGNTTTLTTGCAVETEQSGYIEIQKSSANTDITADNGCYSLAGAVYDVYYGTTKVTSLTTDATGYARSGLLPIGDYTIIEATPSKGFYLDTVSHHVTVTDQTTQTVISEEQPKNDPVSIVLRKKDAETGSVESLGKGSLANAEYTVCYYDTLDEKYQKDGTDPAKDGLTPVRTWIFMTDANGTILLNEAHRVSGDSLYVNEQGTCCLPLGTYTIQETKAPEGYQKDATLYTRQADVDGTIPDYSVHSYNIATSPESVKRGDLLLTKIDADTQKAISGITFKITSLSTGESHYFTTDENGQYSTSSSYCLHSTDTNGGTSDSGIWFGQYTDANGDVSSVAVNDSLGALPYDSYLIEEQRCENNKGRTLFSGTYYITRDNYTLVLNNIENAAAPQLSTFAENKASDDQYLRADEEATIVDTVQMSNLTKGTTYTIRGVLMDKSTGMPATDREGQEITAEKELTFIASGSSVSREMEYIFDASDFGGRDFVVFEYLYEGDELIAEHTDLEDSDQTIHVCDVKTSLTDKETGIHLSDSSEKCTVIDKVDYENLQKGRLFTMKGTLHKTDGAGQDLGILKDENGQPVTVEKKFISVGSGSVELSFTFDASLLDGLTVVAFEECSRNGYTYAVHEDISDEEQSVHIPQVGTTASADDTGDHITAKDNSVTIHDHLTYRNLDPDYSYTAKGTLIDKATGKEILIDGKPVTAEADFTPVSFASNDVELIFTFDASELEVSDLVVFEEVYYKSALAGSHKDTEDEGQTIHFPSISTRAVDTADGDGILERSEDCCVTDTIAYENLIPGQSYTLKGTLIDKKTGEPLTDEDDNIIENSSTFVPKTADGTTELTFTFDSRRMTDGAQLVAFETLYYGNTDITLASHQDLEDAAQTVAAPYSIRISKQDITNGKEIAGAQLEITDEEGTIVDQWISGEDSIGAGGNRLSVGTEQDGTVLPHYSNLIALSSDTAEHVYTLTELKPADGYTTAESIVFKAEPVYDKDHQMNGVRILTRTSDDSENTWKEVEGDDDLLIMYDDLTKVEISKVDITNDDELEGAHLSICQAVTGSNGEITKGDPITVNGEALSWISGSDGKNADGTIKPHYIEGLPVGTYVLSEEQAPEHYDKAEQIIFTVEDSGEIQTVVMKDKPSDGYITLTKVDATDEKTKLEGAEFTIYNDGEEVGRMTTDKNGVATSGPLPIGLYEDNMFDGYIEYTVVETKAPDGYQLSDKAYEVTLYEGGTTNDLGTITNERKGVTSASSGKTTNSGSASTSVNAVKTSDAAPLIQWMILAIAGTVMLVIFGKRRLTDKN